MTNSKVNYDKLYNMLDSSFDESNPIQCYVYEVDNEVVGLFAGMFGESLFTDEVIFQEINFVFREDKAGYAPFMLKGLKKMLENKVDGIILAHMSDNKRLIKLYNKLGFNELETHYLWKRK